MKKKLINSSNLGVVLSKTEMKKILGGKSNYMCWNSETSIGFETAEEANDWARTHDNSQCENVTV